MLNLTPMGYNPLNPPFLRGNTFSPPKGGLLLFPLNKGGRGVVSPLENGARGCLPSYIRQFYCRTACLSPLEAGRDRQVSPFPQLIE